MPALCRDCLTWFDASPGQRCASCGQPRLVAHEELRQLSIAHMDCDAFYAAVEKRDNPELQDKAVIVGGGRRGVVSTCCYIARINGVRSAMPMFKALKLCPEAVVVKPRMDAYVAVSREIRSLMDRLTPMIEPLSLDEAFLDMTGTERLLGAPPAASLARLANEVETKTGITISVGLSHNKYLAKIASDLDKPRGFSVVGKTETLEFLAPRPVRSIWGVGAKLAETLEADGLRTNADLSRADPTELMRRYGTMGKRLSELSRGIDRRRVTADGETKSISSETTFDLDIEDAESLRGHLWRLSVKTSDRAKAKALAGVTVTVKAKTATFRTLTRQAKLHEPTNHAEAIYASGERLLANLLHDAPFRLIGIGISTLTQVEDGTAPEAALFEDPTSQAIRAESATDRIRARFGKDAIIKGRALR